MPESTAPPQGTLPERSTETTYHDPIAALPAPSNGDGHRTSPSAPASVPPPVAAKRSGAAVRKWMILLVILAVVGGAIYKIYRNKQETAATPAGGHGGMGGGPVPVLITSVQQRTIPVYLTALGTVTAYNSVTIKSRVDGQLLSVNVREGQKVSKGQLLAEIDPRPYQAAVAQAEGQLVKDQATAANATAEAGRYTALYGAGVISKESQQAQVSNAGQAGGAIQADQAAIQAARVNVAYTRITSPIDGVVGLRTVDPGNIVHASDTTGLILVTQVQPIAIIFTLPEDQLPEVLKRIREGAKLAVEAYDRSETNHLASGTLLTVDNQIDTTTGTARVKAVFPNTDNALFPNQFVNVRLILQQRPNSLVVPTAALQAATSGNFVYVVRPGNPPGGLDASPSEGAAAGGTGKGKGAAARSGGAEPGSPAATGGGSGSRGGAAYYVEAVPVKIDLTQGSNTVISNGVNAGVEVVIDGQEKLKNGARVIPHAGNPTASSAAAGSASSSAAGNGSTRTGVSGPEGAPASGQNGNGQGNAGKQP